MNLNQCSKHLCLRGAITKKKNGKIWEKFPKGGWGVKKKQTKIPNFNSGVNKKQENSFFFPKQKFRSPCISRSNFAPTPLIYQFLLVFKQQMFELTKKH